MQLSPPNRSRGVGGLANSAVRSLAVTTEAAIALIVESAHARDEWFEGNIWAASAATSSLCSAPAPQNSPVSPPRDKSMTHAVLKSIRNGLSAPDDDVVSKGHAAIGIGGIAWVAGRGCWNELGAGACITVDSRAEATWHADARTYC